MQLLSSKTKLTRGTTNRYAVQMTHTDGAYPMKQLKFNALLLTLVSAIIVLTVYIYSLLQVSDDINLVSIGWLTLNQMGPLILLGIGLGIPLVLLATLFGWVQLILTMNGAISPHLSSKGFLDAVYTLVVNGSDKFH
jgi:hypothetical protein